MLIREFGFSNTQCQQYVWLAIPEEDVQSS
jgi:hypothetical protein